LIKNEEETETITFQISTTELTKRKAKNKKKSHFFGSVVKNGHSQMGEIMADTEY